jgi:hypothetical protein
MTQARRASKKVRENSRNADARRDVESHKKQHDWHAAASKMALGHVQDPQIVSKMENTRHNAIAGAAESLAELNVQFVKSLRNQKRLMSNIVEEAAAMRRMLACDTDGDDAEQQQDEGHAI